jgi:hypothetical protein
MFNSLRKLLRPTLRQQLEDGVREALRRYADRRIAPDLRVYVSTDLVPEGMSAGMFARDEGEHLRRFAAQWAQDNGIARAGIRVEMILLDTKKEFAFVKPLGLVEEAQPPADQLFPRGAGERALVAEQPRAPAPPAAPFAQPAPFAAGGGAPQPGGRGALLEVVSSETWRDPVRVDGETIFGRKPEAGVFALGDRYMSGRHARFRAASGRLYVADLDSKNRTFVNDQPLTPHQEREMSPGDTVRMGNTVLRLTRVD